MLEMLEQDENREDQQEAGGGLQLLLQHSLDSNGPGGSQAGTLRGRDMRRLPVMEALENDDGEEEEPAPRGTPLLSYLTAGQLRRMTS